MELSINFLRTSANAYEFFSSKLVVGSSNAIIGHFPQNVEHKAILIIIEASIFYPKLVVFLISIILLYLF